MTRERAVAALCLLCAGFLILLIDQCAPRYRPEPPEATPVLVILPTPTPDPITPTPSIVGPVVTPGPPTWGTRTPTTPFADQVPTRAPLPTATPTSTPEPTATPTATPTPDRPAIQRG